MAIVQNGSFTVATGGVAQNLDLGFIPTRFTMWDLTKTAATPVAGIVKVDWFPQMANGTALVTTSTVTTGILTYNLLATNGITPYYSVTPSQLWTPTQLTITNISNAAQARITATHKFTSADIGVTTVTISGVQGMTQINTLRGVIQSVTSTTSFTVNINSTTFSAYTSGGVANIITGIPASETVGFQVFNTPQSNAGFIGLTLGSSVMVTTSDVWVYEAVLDAPFTSA